MARQSSTADRVKKVMVEALDLSLHPDQLDDDLSLYSPVIRMDSLNLLRLIVALEEEFDGQIDDEDVMEADLENVDNLIDLVDKRLAS
ncbi:acyl carrier protein [Rubrobacter naiadicus]|uniref:acyl carrier protein n=1 Tax=Rubrobacter naiadicus TaxID=1392641 RepID=UPI00235E6231|nr:acyl carrier protein [Rubrobacter naiadicus]